MVDKDIGGFSVEQLRAWKQGHETMIAEIRQHGWSSSIELLRSGQMAPGLAREIIALIKDRRAFWAKFDAEFPDRVRMSLEGFWHDLTRLRRDCTAGSPLDVVIVALGQTVRHFLDAVERLDLTTLRCDSGDPDWRAFDAALRALRKTIGYQIAALADSYAIPLRGEFAAYTAPDVGAIASSVWLAETIANLSNTGPLLIDRDRASNVVRSDLTAHDISLLMHGVAATMGYPNRDWWRRFLELALDGIRGSSGRKT